MSNTNEKPIIWVGSGKENQYGINISICLTDLPAEYITKSEKNGKKYINLKVGKKATQDQYGKTHGVSVDTWKKEDKDKEYNTATHYPDKITPAGADIDDLPF